MSSVKIIELDKATVLGDAMRYTKELEEQVKTLEEEEPTVVVKRARIISSNYGSENSNNISTDQYSFPEIEVRASNGNVLIRICCKKQNGMLKEIFSQVEKLNLSIISTSVMPFGCTTTHKTIIAQMDHQLSKSAEDGHANRIRMAIMKLINGQEEASFLQHK